jgi:hypothetical protein
MIQLKRTLEILTKKHQAKILPLKWIKSFQMKIHSISNPNQASEVAQSLIRVDLSFKKKK